ncbi:MAG: hypothetical protein LBV29_03040 [Azoarcus sp.]|jgi:hypothetical protein|nr:hypothetical protein [Azoarcus sp.]
MTFLELMNPDTLRLHLGELTPNEISLAQSAVALACVKIGRSIPPDWQLVPKKPTEAMVTAGITAEPGIPSTVYALMLEAAPIYGG